MAWLSERTDYRLTNSNYNISLNPYKVTTSIRILIWCSCVSEDTKWVLPLLRFVAIWCDISYSNICSSKHAFSQSLTWFPDKYWLAAAATSFNLSLWLVHKPHSNTLFKSHLVKYHFGFNSFSNSFNWIVSR